MLIVLVPEAPWPTVTVLGAAVREKLATAAAVTVRDTVVVLVKLPDVPVIVTVAVPVVAVLLAASVNTLVLLAGFVENEAVTPVGSPDADRFTLPLNPFCGVTVIVLVPLAPCATLKLPGAAESV